MDWIFNGIGTQIVAAIISFLIIGAGVVYAIRISNRRKQRQKAGKNATQNMTDINMSIGNVNNSVVNQAKGDIINNKNAQ